MTAASRDLYIVSAERTELYELLKRRLGLGETAEVILDRRQDERRTEQESPRDERRHAERRYYDAAHLLRTIGVILVSGDRRGAP